MALSLIEKQFVFARNFSMMVHFAQPNHRITYGEFWRSKETCELYAKEGKGIKNSCHELRLAADINLWIIRSGQLITPPVYTLSLFKDDYEYLGMYWKALSTPEYTCCWGGDFHSLCDFFHFSIEHNGVR